MLFRQKDSSTTHPSSQFSISYLAFPTPRKSLQLNQYYWKANRTLGEILMKEGNYKEASEYFESGIKYGYLNAEKYGSLGAKKEDYSAMLEKYRTALEKDAVKV